MLSVHSKDTSSTSFRVITKNGISERHARQETVGEN